MSHIYKYLQFYSQFFALPFSFLLLSTFYFQMLITHFSNCGVIILRGPSCSPLYSWPYFSVFWSSLFAPRCATICCGPASPKILLSRVYRSFPCLVRDTPSYFILFEAIVEMVDSVISFSNHLSFLCRRALIFVS